MLDISGDIHQANSAKATRYTSDVVYQPLCLITVLFGVWCQPIWTDDGHPGFNMTGMPAVAWIPVLNGPSRLDNTVAMTGFFCGRKPASTDIGTICKTSPTEV